MRLAGLVMLGGERLFQARQYVPERIDNQRPALLDYLDQIVIAHGTDDDGQLAAGIYAAIYFVGEGMRFFERVDKWHGVGLKGVVGELRQQAHAESFSGDRRAVG
jgi:hypothetical protein